jgi:tRNA(Ile)-lysidine synthase
LLTATSRAEPLTLAEFGASLAALAQFESRPFLAVAVSGGPDSLALSILADRWSCDRGGEICALIVDHRLRPESGAEARTVAAWLEARSIRHAVLAWTGEKPQSGIQAAARDARYRLLAGWCRANGCLHLLTAHHREDQLETHLIRRRAHSGPDGLAGMSAIRELVDCRLLRPLLGFPRMRLRALLEAEGQPFISDPSNFDPAFERSRLRLSDSSVTGTGDDHDQFAAVGAYGIVRSAHQRAASAAFGRFVTMHPAGFATLDPAMVDAVPPWVAERVLSAVFATIGGNSYSPRRDPIARLREVIASQRRGHSLGGSRFLRWRQHVFIIRELASAARPALLAPGTRISWDRRFEVSLVATARKPLSIGYLGAVGVAELNRLRLPLKRDDLPRLLFPLLPTAWDNDGIAAVPHLGFRRKGILDVPRFVFRPRNPLTQAEFAVV